MNCPICKLDLTPLDLLSRTEHVDLCLENGPTVIDIGESGKLVIKKNVPPGKQRIICPICDKTFQNILSHYKTCALKNDVPPNMMLDQWDLLNKDSKNPKPFPSDLLNNFIKKCTQEGRTGLQVDIAKAILLSLRSEDNSNTLTQADNESLSADVVNPTTSNSDPAHVSQTRQIPIAPVFSSTSTSSTTVNAVYPRSIPPKKTKSYRLEAVNESTKRNYIALRVERELSASRSNRYMKELDGNTSDTDAVILMSDEDARDSINVDHKSKLFHRARLKDCNGSEGCLNVSCVDHELELLLDDFKCYSGASMDADPKNRHDIEASTNKELD